MRKRLGFFWFGTAVLLHIIGCTVSAEPTSAAGLSSQNSEGIGCSSKSLSLVPCLPYLITGSTSLVTTRCCIGFTSVLDSDPVCICELTKNAISNNVNNLPAICNVTNVISDFCPGSAPLRPSASKHPSNRGMKLSGGILKPATVILVPTPIGAPQNAGIRESIRLGSLMALVALATILPVLYGH